MNALLALLALILSVAIAFLMPGEGPSALVICAVLAFLAGVVISRVGDDRRFLLQVFVAALLLRVMVGAIISFFQRQEFFGGDALTYDNVGYLLARYWQGAMSYSTYQSVLGPFMQRNWGMPYMVAVVYALVGRNMLAVQFVNAVLGAITSPVIYLCTRLIFSNSRAARLAALSVAFYPSLVLWSSQGLKDGPIVFLLTLAMLATLKLGARLSIKYLAVLVFALFGLLSFRFYIFYMMVAAVAGAFVIGSRRLSSQSLARQFAIIVVVGMALMYLGVLRTASAQLDTYANLQAVQVSRADLASSASSGFGQDVDVSTTSGALSAIPLGMTYLLFAPFPWQLGSLRQSITLPEMMAWWCSFPLLILGLWFTLKHRLRPALPILLFTTMLTLAYSVFQGNVGTAYRQRSQLLVFYFIFVAVGGVLLLEKRDGERRLREEAKRATSARARATRKQRREEWKSGRGREIKETARGLSERVDI